MKRKKGGIEQLNIDHTIYAANLRVRRFLFSHHHFSQIPGMNFYMHNRNSKTNQISRSGEMAAACCRKFYFWGGHTTQNKNNPAPNPRTRQVRTKATCTSIGSLDTGSRHVRTGIERRFGGHGRSVIMPQRARTVSYIPNPIIRLKGDKP